MQTSVFRCIQVIAIVPVIQSNTKSKSEYEIRMYAPSYDKHPRCRREGSEKLYLAENIKYLREQDGLTQKEFAEKLGVSSGAIAMWESGMREPELSRIIKLAEYFSVTLDDFILTELRPPAPMYAQNIKYLRKLHGMTQEDMANLLGYRGKQGYNAIETGKAKATVENLEKISDFFGVTLDQLVKQDFRKELPISVGEAKRLLSELAEILDGQSMKGAE